MIKNEQERQRIGQRIAEMRKAMTWIDDAGVTRNGMSQYELSRRTGLGQAHIARIEMGMYGVSIDVLAQIAEALDASIEIRKRAAQ